jgi:ribosomal protein L21E
MKIRISALTLAVLFASVAVCSAAEDLSMGTWKLNEAKSQIGPGSPKNSTVVYAAMGDNVKVTVDGVGVDGAPTHNEWTGKFDGKDYPVIGDPTSDTRAYKRVNDHTLALTVKKAGKVSMSGLIILSADGQIRIVNVNGKNAKGKPIKIYGVYDKQ